jgi:sigma-B regulation protein RsbU (phosphoserine phosphatase)
MRVLLVEDDAVAREALHAVLTAQGHEVMAVDGGPQAWDAWRTTRHRIIVADWLMPDLDGLELCRRIRTHQMRPYTYFLLETIRTGRASFLEAMRAGVDDFISKPINPEELVARLAVAERMLGLREELTTLEGLLSICSYCKRLRNDGGTWIPLERYVEDHTGGRLSHGICPDCYVTHVKPLLDA